MAFHVDSWDPGYGVSMDADRGGPGDASSAKVDVAVEVNPDRWEPLEAPAGMTRPSTILLVDGVRRIDGRIWTTDVYEPLPGIACSYAAGVVRCQDGLPAQVVAAKVERGLFTASPEQRSIDAGDVVYAASCHQGADQQKLVAAAQAALINLEKSVVDSLHSDATLTIVDGPIRGAGGSPFTIGYVKTQQKRYLPERLLGVVGALRAGQRSPIFRLGGQWERYTWYLRQPGHDSVPWSGIVRVECSADLPEDRAIELANLSVLTLPRLATSSVKDPRAPQQLLPIAGLEKQLRRLLGDSRLLHRRLLSASAIAASA
jgi:hypothetical protein